MTWMKHVDHGGIADLPDLPYWRGAGWEPTDERPVEPDLLRDPQPEPPPEAPDDSKLPGLPAAKTTSAAKAKKTEES
jgi:hypothetical protein